MNLVALEPKYHRPCYQKFINPTRLSTNTMGRPTSDHVASSMEKIFQYIEENKDKCQFTLTELSNVIEDPPTAPTIKSKLLDKYKDDIVFHSQLGRATIISIRDHQGLSDSWYLNKLPLEAHERVRIVQTAAAIVLEDIETKTYDTDTYPSPDQFLHEAEEDVPDTLQLFLEKLILNNKKNSQDKYTKQCIALAHCVIAATRPRSFTSSLQVGLSAFLHSKYGSKTLIQVLSSLGFCASYPETETFQLSAVLHPEEDFKKGFVQFIADNADVNVATLDGHGTFHSMGIIQSVTPKPTSDDSRRIVRVTGIYGRSVIKNIKPVAVQTFIKDHQKRGLQEITAEAIDIDDLIAPSIADILWMYGKTKDIPRICGWNGFMEKLTCQRSYATSEITVLPFINAPPSDWNTVYTTLVSVAERARKCGQQSCAVTFDQPMYKKAREILAFSSGPLLDNVIVRLGGFHLLMSFLGCIGYIMAGSGLKEILSIIYAPVSVDKMLSGHAYARAIRGHFLTQLVLGQLILEQINFSADEQIEIEDLLEELDSGTVEHRLEEQIFSDISERVQSKLQTLSENGQTAALWIQYFQMVVLVKQFIEAERTGNWKLHLSTIAKMIPFFHAAGHSNYALCAHLYLQDMNQLETKMGFRDFHNFVSNGYFTIRRTHKFWSGIWSDMTIEQTLMRSMKTAGGLTRGRGLTDSVLAKWILGMPLMQKVSETLENFVGIESSSSEQHVDARPTRQARDNADIRKLQRWFESHDPFPVLDNIVSLSTGVVGGPQINCHKTQSIGLESLNRVIGKQFSDISFPRKNRVLPLSAVTSSLKVPDTVVTVDLIVLYQRNSFLKESQQQLQSFFGWELSPYPLSLFDEIGMRKSKKSAMFKLFTATEENVTEGDVLYVIDGGHLLHKVVWQKGDTYSQICNTYIRKNYGDSVKVVFDGYPEAAADMSTKTSERVRRLKPASVDVIFDESMPCTTSQEKFLSNGKNKAQLITALKSKLLNAGYDVKQHKEDADTLIIHTALEDAANYQRVIIVGEDGDLLVILNGIAEDRHSNVYFMKVGKGKVATSIFSSNSLKKENLAGHILTCHAFTGCDTTSALFNQGKMKLTKLALKDSDIQKALECFTEPNAQPDDLDDAGEKILVKMYGGTSAQSLTKLRYDGFTRSITKSKYNLSSLPPTKTAARQHSLRVYHQVQQWLGNDLPPTSWGWTRGLQGLSPILTTQEAAPPDVLKLVSCRCEKGCSTATCSCRKSGLKCTQLCLSCHGETCSNVREIEIDGTEDDEADAVKNSLLNAENDDFGEPQDPYLDDDSDEAVVHQLEAENLPEETAGEIDLIEDGSPSGPTTRKKRRILENA